MARKNFSKRILAERFAHCGGRCEGTLENDKRCNVVLVPGRWHGDHHDPDAMTGEPTFDNCRCLCLPCHAVKTKADVKIIAKAKRQHYDHIGVKVEKQKIPSPPKRMKPARDRLPPFPRTHVCGVPVK